MPGRWRAISRRLSAAELLLKAMKTLRGILWRGRRGSGGEIPRPPLACWSACCGQSPRLGEKGRPPADSDPDPKYEAIAEVLGKPLDG